MSVHNKRQLIVVTLIATGLLGACGSGESPGTAAGDETGVRTAGFDRAPVFEIEPTPYSSQHFDDAAWLGTPVPEPVRSKQTPLTRVDKAPDRSIGSKNIIQSNTKRLSDYRAQLLESAAHIGPGDGHWLAELETNRLTRQHGHDPVALSEQLEALLYICRTPAIASDKQPQPHEESVK